jgi:integrase
VAKRITLTHRLIKELSRKAPKSGGREMVYMDALVPPLGIRPSGKDYHYAFVGRFPGSKNPTRRDLGKLGVIDLADVRDKARSWIALIERGIDPKIEEERQRQAKLRLQATTFAAVADEYLNGPVAKRRTASDTERLFRKELLPTLGARPITEITRFEVKELLTAIMKRPALRTAMIVYQHVHAIYGWAIEQEVYGLEGSPTALIKPKTFFGERKPRTRVLNDNELRAFWHATERLKYPMGPLLQLLLLTGCREAEIGESSWCEISPDKMLLTVPRERFKSDAVHLVALAGDARSILDALPRFGKGDFVFSTTAGERPVNGYGKAKRRLDKLMTDELGHAPEPWVFHDLRRTCRTRLSSLRVSFEVAEMVIGHGKRGMARIYDQHEKLDEMREAVEAWAVRLRSIVTPPPANVVQFGAIA